MRKYLLATVKILALAFNVSETTARRRAAAMPGAVRTRRGWVVPVTTDIYAAGTGVSQRTAQRRGTLAGSPTDPKIQSLIEPGIPRRGRVPWTDARRDRMVSARIWPWQAQGYAWLRRLASGDIFKAFTGTLVFGVEPTWTVLRNRIISDIRDKFVTSPVEIVSIGVVYTWRAA